MELIIVLAGVLVVIAVVWALFLRKKEPDHVESPPSLDDVRQGGVVVVKGNEYLVEQRNRYTEAGGEWFELKLTGDEGRTYWLDWQECGGMNVSLTQEMPFASLGLTPDDLATFDDEESGSFDFDDVIYYYAASGESQMYENDGSESEAFYYWNFEDEEHENVINVARWSGGDYEAAIGSYINASDVDIYSAGSTE